MTKVKVKYTVYLNKGYAPAKYLTKMINIEIPKNELGFILFTDLTERIYDYLAINVIPEIYGATSFKISSHQIQ